MQGRIRIDRSELSAAPEPPSNPGIVPTASTGEVFGTVAGIRGGSGTVAASVWLNPKFLYTAAGVVAAIAASIVADGIGGFGRDEAAGREPSVFVVALLPLVFVSLLTAAIAAVDDIVAGAFGRGAIFGGLGLVSGLVGGAVAFFLGGICMAVIEAIVLDRLTAIPSDGEALALTMLTRAPAWLVAGLLSGAAIGAMGRSWKRVLLGSVGGALGGLVGGMLFDPIGYLMATATDSASGAASRLVGLLIMGSAMGFSIAFAESAAKRVWLTIERGRLVGKQFILYRNPTSIGAAYSNDVFLFKDPTVQPLHARLVKRGGGWVAECVAGAHIRVNAQPVTARSIADGDSLQVGETVMRFHAKA
jgi:hypothetical protein